MSCKMKAFLTDLGREMGVDEQYNKNRGKQNSIWQM